MAIVTLSAGVDRSGTIATGGEAVVVAAENVARRGLTGQNISTGDLWINETGGDAEIGAAGSYCVLPWGHFQVSSNRRISITGATAGQEWTATEF